VKRAYRDKCLKLHPDVNADARPEDFVRVTNAYNYLTDISKNQNTSYANHQHRYAGGNTLRRPPKQKFSPALVALIISLPLVLGGIRAGLYYDRFLENTYRVNGLLEPPVNEFLSREEARRLPSNRKSSRDAAAEGKRGGKA